VVPGKIYDVCGKGKGLTRVNKKKQRRRLRVRGAFVKKKRGPEFNDIVQKKRVQGGLNTGKRNDQF